MPFCNSPKDKTFFKSFSCDHCATWSHAPSMHKVMFKRGKEDTLIVTKLSVRDPGDIP
jgi:hypothetical protein